MFSFLELLYWLCASYVVFYFTALRLKFRDWNILLGLVVAFVPLLNMMMAGVVIHELYRLLRDEIR